MTESETVVYGIKLGDGPIRYVGISNNLKQRISSHWYNSKDGNAPVNRWLRKHSGQGLIWLILETCPNREQAFNAEIRWISFLGLSNLLNVEPGGPGQMRAVGGVPRKPRTVKQHIPKHGTNSEYGNWSCRCNLCKKAHAIYCADYKLKKSLK